ncbi:MAG: hypothetical protein OXK78_14860 [Caldilineaceae bacterium]|nr:hypothetical protein [Caldilineaceae bacterium]
MIEVLFVEDEVDFIKPILDDIHQKVQDVNCTISGFDDVEEKIRSLRPNIVVLDLIEGPLSDNNRGIAYLDFIWKQQFCPVIVHTGFPDLFEGYENPFVQLIQKGQDSSENLLESIRYFEPHVRSLKEVDDHIRESFASALRDVAPYAFDTFEEVKQRNDAILRAGRRRLAGLMDEHPGEGQVLASWEQYLCPPISEDILLGDILRETDREGTDPSLFRVVLSPSCDLVSSGGRQPKISEILVARCCSIKRGVELMGWGNINAGKLKDRLNPILSRGYSDTLVPLPALKSRIPTMMANLRDLELIPFGDVSSEGSRFIRVASLDSPFRELISWAYMQVSARPGVPDRDTVSWCDEIVDDYQS